MKDDDFKLLRGFADGQMDKQTNEQTFVIVESLSRLKMEENFENFFLPTFCLWSKVFCAKKS